MVKVSDKTLPRFYRRLEAPEHALWVDPSEDLGRPPELLWVELDRLVVDQRYQREISDRGAAVVRKIVRGFRWEKFQPISVVRGEAGFLVVADGQHRALAAAAHPMVDKIPAYLVHLPGFRAQAAAFVALNQVRTRITPQEIFYAELAAGDADAMQIQRVLDDAGVVVQKNTFPQGVKPRHTVAVQAIRHGIRKWGEDVARDALTAVAESHSEEWNQLQGYWIKAAFEAVAGGVSRTDLQRFLASVDLLRERNAAQARAAIEGIKIHEALVSRLREAVHG